MKFDVNISQFSDKKGSMSNMRKNFSLITYAGVGVFGALIIYILAFGIRGDEITNWAAMGVFVGAVASAVWSVGREKRKQKEVE